MKTVLQFIYVMVLAATCVSANLLLAGQPLHDHPGYRLLINMALIPPDFDQETIDSVWQVWPHPIRQQAELSSVEVRRQMIFDRYGLTPRPDDPVKPLQYVVDANGKWTMNCFACHGGQVGEQIIPGAPNREFDLQTLTEETRRYKIRQGTKLARMDLGSIFVPLGSTRGTTNAVMFGVALMHFRDLELNVIEPVAPPAMQHHDMDAPPWWNYSLRSHIYIDGFAQRGHRSLMQFALVRENRPDWFHRNEASFRDVDDYLMSLSPPKYPFAMDEKLGAKGRDVFNRNCAECHGVYGASIEYPGRCIPIAEIGTDPIRLGALSAANRQAYGKSWFGSFGKEDTVADPGGYVAPPLSGLWASAPYLHNGSVPTLWHLLHPEERPTVWHRLSTTIDTTCVGLTVEAVDAIPSSERDVSERRKYFDTLQHGKSAAGHDFPNKLTDLEKTEVLEYLKSL